MQEYVTEALVLSVKAKRENDRLVSLYTKDLGKIDARVVSGAKIISKFSNHLNVLNRVFVRLVEKNRFTVADVILQDRFVNVRRNKNVLSRALRAAFIINELMPNNVPDACFWDFFLRSMESGNINTASFLRFSGYNVSYASCGFCGGKNLSAFSVKEHIFLCKSCSFKISENKVLLE